MRRLIQLSDMTPEMWNDSHDAKINEFLSKIDKKLLVFYVDPTPSEDGQYKLRVLFEIPSVPTPQFTFFIKSHYSNEINNKELFHKNVQYGTFGGKYLSSLLRLTSGLYAPLFFGNKTWPDSIS